MEVNGQFQAPATLPSIAILIVIPIPRKHTTHHFKRWEREWKVLTDDELLNCVSTIHTVLQTETEHYEYKKC